MAQARRTGRAVRPWVRRALGLGAWWPSLFAVYLLFGSPLSAAEIGAGILLAGVTAGAAVAATGPFSPAPPPPGLRWSRLAWVAADVTRDVGSLGQAVVKEARRGSRQGSIGTFEEVHLPHVDDSTDAGTRAYGELVLSLTPGEYVVDVDVRSGRRDRVLVHRIGAPARTRGTVLR
jgi:hypothetical protein